MARVSWPGVELIEARGVGQKLRMDREFSQEDPQAEEGGT
jgi:hypothetical protein